MNLINSIQSEWLKTKRSSASWLCLIGGAFIPLILFIASIYRGESMNNFDGNGWGQLFKMGWSSMGQFLLPMGVILAASMITQIEYKNNAWKQVHASPQSYVRIFASKFIVILLMTLKFFLFFNIGLIVAGLLTTILIDGTMPDDSFPLWNILKLNVKFFITCLPILAIQFLLSMIFKNFLAPVGIGLLGIIGSLIALSWEHLYTIPYSYTIMETMPFPRDYNIYWYSIVYFVILTSISFVLYVNKKEKG